MGSMIAILAGLLFVALSADGMARSRLECAILRVRFWLHGGWIIAASTLNVSVVAKGRKAAPDGMLALAVASMGDICVFAKSPDSIVCCVPAWTFNAISAKLSDPVDLNSDEGVNLHTWDPIATKGLENGISYIAYLALMLAAVAETPPSGCQLLCRQRDGDHT